MTDHNPSLRKQSAPPRPWLVVWEHSNPEGWACLGIKADNGEWVARFDDDYGNDQAANAELIVEAVNAT